MIDLLFQLSVYYLSFTPLWIAVILMDFFSIINGEINLWTEYISIPLLIFVFAIAITKVRRVFNNKDCDSTKEYELKSAEEEKLLAAEFLMSFVLPLFVFDFTKYQSVILFLVFFLIFGWLCYRHNYFCNNVVLEFMHYKVYDCICQTYNNVSIEKKIISKRLLPQCVGDTIRTRSLNNEYMLDCYLPEK